ncbi:class I SAM-dependent methyltransferase [Micromonospora sp. MS34]|uniref:class I SAM-dependent methyltransferase n=1 Tax=Micromonospora sp. MS34 TaxID=3385971 RepID=UPI0039A3C4CD
MDEVTTRNRAAYDRIAADFAARNPAMPATYRALAGEFQDRLDGPLLDLGCGPGRDLAFWVERGATPVGLDLSAAMLREAGRVGAPLVQGDLLRLPLCTGAVGGVWCSAALLHLPKAVAPAALAGFRRVLRPGGPLLLSVKEGEGESWARWPGEDADRFFAWYRPDEVEGLLRAAGFAPLRLLTDVSDIGQRWLCHLAEAA